MMNEDHFEFGKDQKKETIEQQFKIKYEKESSDEKDDNEKEKTSYLSSFISDICSCFFFGRPDVREFKRLFDMDEENGLKNNKKAYIIKESIKKNKNHIKIILSGLCMICFVLAFFCVAVTCYVLQVNGSDLTFVNVKKAGETVSSFARDSVLMIHQTSQVFISELRKEYDRRKKEQQELLKYGKGDYEEQEGAVGNMPQNSIENAQEKGNDPIDWRHSSHPYLSEIINKHNDPKQALPSVCPMLKDHLEIFFNLSEFSFDVFGYPCAMEMHWSKKWTDQDVNNFQSDFIMNNEKGAHRGELDSKGKILKPFNPKSEFIDLKLTKYVESRSKHGRINSIHSGMIKCSRTYRLKGFTPWICTPNHKIPIRYKMIYSVGCTEVDQKGDVNVQSKESTYYNRKEFSEWIDLSGQDQMKINPAYDKSVQKLKQGHYCYINYAFVDNPNIIFSLKLLVLGIVLHLLCGFFLTMFIITEKTTIIMWICSFIFNFWIFVCFMVSFYFTSYIPIVFYKILAISSLVIGILSGTTINLYGCIFIVKKKCVFKNAQKPYLMRMVNSLSIIFEDASSLSPQNFKKPKGYNFDIYQGARAPLYNNKEIEEEEEEEEETFYYHTCQQESVSEECRICLNESKLHSSYALQPSDKEYGATLSVKHKKPKINNVF